MKIYNFLILILFSAFLGSCSEAGDEYNFVYKNIGKKDLNIISSSFGKFKGGCGVLLSGRKKSYNMVHKYGEVSKEVLIKWKRQIDGVEFEKKIKLSSKIPTGTFKGNIIFLFNNDDVSLTWEKE